MTQPAPPSVSPKPPEGGDADIGERAAAWEQTARDMIAQGKADDHSALEAQATVEQIESVEALGALGVLATLAELQSDWVTAVRHWQLMGSIAHPVTTKSLTHVAKNPHVRQRWTTYAGHRLKRARCTLAQHLDQQGKRRARDEIIARVIETVPNQIALKSDDTFVALAGSYIRDALTDDAMVPELVQNPEPVRIALCYDVLMGSDGDAADKEIIGMCQRLLSKDAALELHLVITNERFIVSTPDLPATFTSEYEAGFAEALRRAMQHETGSRFFVHVFTGKGLEGAVDACAGIIRIAPDVISYGGGHSRPYSNASRIVRQCLYPYLPTALHHLGSDDLLDDCYDAILTDDLFDGLSDVFARGKSRRGVQI